MNKKSISIRKKIATPLFFLIAIQNIIFVSGIVASGVTYKLDDREYMMVSEQVERLSNDLVEIMDELSFSTQTTSEYLTSRLGYDFNENDIIDTATEQLISLTYRENITGAFFVLNNSDSGLKNKGTYIRDSHPNSIFVNNSDISMIVGSKETADRFKINLDSNWKSEYDFENSHNNELFNSDFYIKPYTSSLNYENKGISKLGYWSEAFKFNSTDKKIITYSVPVFSKNKKTLGVIGIEISIESIFKQMPSRQIQYADGFYAVGKLENSILKNAFIDNGNGFMENVKLNYENDNSVEIISDNSDIIDKFKNSSIMVIQSEIDIYNDINIYGSNDWVLAAIVRKSSIQSESRSLINSLIISFIVSFAVGAMIIILLGGHITNPIEKLADEVKHFDPDSYTKFSRTNTTEIDYLIDLIESLNKTVAISSARMSKIVEAIDLPIGCFEVNIEKNKVFLTDKLFSMFDIEKQYPEQKFVELNKWETIIENLLLNYVEDRLDCYIWKCKDGKSVRWLDMKLIGDNGRSIGIIMDISDEILKNKTLEYERDHDSLTQLFNRRTFVNRCKDTVLKNPNKMGAMIFADLDNLKFVNDTYGHSYGDEYIKTAANMFNCFTKYGAIVARMSGDEFAIFLYGYDSEEEISSIIEQVFNENKNRCIVIPKDELYPIKASKGIALYPKDSDSISELIKYADFAMYTVKKSSKGGVREFDLDSYVTEKYF